MILFPNAKINIGLYVTEKRADGYHNLETVFYPLRIKDALEIIPSDTLAFSSSGLEIPGRPEENLCIKAFQLLREDFEIPPVHIHLHKRIPMGAGLGGGSSDAAYVLKMLNEMFSLAIDIDRLEQYAAKLGADCPFFIRNQAVFADERGDRFSDLNLDLSTYFLTVVMPPVHVSTADAFYNINPRKPSQKLTETVQRPLEEWKDIISNDFESNVFNRHPVVGEIKESLYRSGAIYASMSGSGAAVYGIFSEDTRLPDLESRFQVFYNIG